MWKFVYFGLVDDNVFCIFQFTCVNKENFNIAKKSRSVSHYTCTSLKATPMRTLNLASMQG